MNIEDIIISGKRITIKEDDQEIARARIYFIKNDLHDKPYALMEDVYTHEDHRGKGLGEQVVKQCIKEAKNHGCYKIIGTSRHERENVHRIYERIGFQDHGKEFRLDL